MNPNIAHHFKNDTYASGINASKQILVIFQLLVKLYFQLDGLHCTRFTNNVNKILWTILFFLSFFKLMAESVDVSFVANLQMFSC